MGSTFSAVTALTPTGSDSSAAASYDADVHPDWTIAGKPNGGYLLAILGRAAVAAGPHPHVIAASATYLRPPDPGPVQIIAELLRGGRSASQLRVRMLQGDATCIESLITTSELQRDTEPYWSGVAVPDIADADQCLRVPSISPTGLPVPIMDQIDLRLDPADTGFARGEPSGRGELRGWLALPGDEAFDPISLLFAVDAFPPATFEVAPSGWVPTLQLSAYVRALPEPGAVRVVHRAQLIAAEKVDEVCSVWDHRGQLVAQGSQLAGIRLK
jgi:hypothetical protein